MYRSSLISLIAGLTCIVALMGAPVECWQAECRVWVAIIGGSLFMAGCALRVYCAYHSRHARHDVTSMLRGGRTAALIFGIILFLAGVLQSLYSRSVLLYPMLYGFLQIPLPAWSIFKERGETGNPSRHIQDSSGGVVRRQGMRNEDPRDADDRIDSTVSLLLWFLFIILANIGFAYPDDESIKTVVNAVFGCLSVEQSIKFLTSVLHHLEWKSGLKKEGRNGIGNPIKRMGGAV